MTRSASPAARCPICGRAADTATRPFCSARCAEVDLGRWLTAQYAVPGDAAGPAPDDEDAG
jgi:endogenous inhibitor of DNA gyrase (YacG/DUF329 family)